MRREWDSIFKNSLRYVRQERKSWLKTGNEGLPVPNPSRWAQLVGNVREEKTRFKCHLCQNLRENNTSFRQSMGHNLDILGNDKALTCGSDPQSCPMLPPPSLPTLHWYIATRSLKAKWKVSLFCKGRQISEELLPVCATEYPSDLCDTPFLTHTVCLPPWLPRPRLKV